MLTYPIPLIRRVVVARVNASRGVGTLGDTASADDFRGANTGVTLMDNPLVASDEKPASGAARTMEQKVLMARKMVVALILRFPKGIGLRVRVRV